MDAEVNKSYEEIQEPVVEYDDEILEAGWNPAVSLVAQEQHAKSVAMPPDLATEVVEHFLETMYVMQR
jgi:predicted molibdopterin-dependent oxidoreductase YjgC